MPKKILLIENDAAFAGELSRALEASGFEPHVSADGKDALDLARELAPEAIVLCVELPGMSGYLVCQKLKKDEALRGVPLVLTSAEATEETFEKHRTLKARADEYMLKPFEPAALVEKLGALVGLPEGAPAAADDREEEVVNLEEETGLEATAEGEPGQEIPGLDLQSLPDEPPAAGGGIEPDELKLLDEAFDGLSAPPAPDEAAAALDLELAGEKPVRLEEVDAAADSLPEEDEGALRPDLGALDEDAERALGALGGADESLSLPDEPKPASPPLRGASADALRAAGIKVLDDEAPKRAETPAPGAPAAAPDGEATRRLEHEIEEMRREMGELANRAESAEAEARKAQDQLESAREEARRSEEEACAAEAQLGDLRAKLADAERRASRSEEEARRRAEEVDATADAISKAEALEREVDELRTELLVARGEAEGARGEVEKRTAELRKRLTDLEAGGTKNEERVVKAYQKIKADEKVREKVRKALAIAMQLLEEGLPAEPPAEKERRTSAAAGRE